MEEKETKKPNKFTQILRRVFVDNLGYKALALAISCVLFVLCVGL